MFSLIFTSIFWAPFPAIANTTLVPRAVFGSIRGVGIMHIETLPKGYALVISKHWEHC